MQLRKPIYFLDYPVGHFIEFFGNNIHQMSCNRYMSVFTNNPLYM